MRVLLVPLVGPFHSRFPRYNAVEVREAIRAAKVDAIAIAALLPGELGSPAWQATHEIALPLSVVPWAQNAGLSLREVGSAAGFDGVPGSPQDASEFEGYLRQFDAGKQRLARVSAAQRPIGELLSTPLNNERILNQLIPAIADYQELRRNEFEEGPGTEWLAARTAKMLDNILLMAADLAAEHSVAVAQLKLAVLASVDDVPSLAAALSGAGAEVEYPSVATTANLESRQRALLDVAMTGQIEDNEALLKALREIPEAEARYHEANLLLAHGLIAEAHEALSSVMRLEFHQPYFLPGFVLARLGQLNDLLGMRKEALRAYRGVMALTFAPIEAVEVAKAGLGAPFALPPQVPLEGSQLADG